MSGDNRSTIVDSESRRVPPVQRADELPTLDNREGDICFVVQESRSYVFKEGSWQPRGKQQA